MKKEGLSKLEVELLSSIYRGDNRNALLHRKLTGKNGKPVPKSTISRYTTKLTQYRLISCTTLFNEREFSLTERGKLLLSNILARSEAGSIKFPIRGHNIRFKSKIVRRPEGFVKKLQDSGWIESYPKNWVAYRNKVEGCSVMFGSQFVQFMLPPMYGNSAEDCHADAGVLVLKVKDAIEQDYPGLILGTPERTATVVSHHYAQPFNPIARFYDKKQEQGKKKTYNGERLTVDYSEGFPELEATNPIHAIDDQDKMMTFCEDVVKNDVGWTDLLERIRALEKEIRLAVKETIAQLPASFTIRKASSKTLSSSFTINNPQLEAQAESTANNCWLRACPPTAIF